MLAHFRCNTTQRMCPNHVKPRLPVFARRRTFPRLRPSLSRFSGVSAVTWRNACVRVTLSFACLFSPDVTCFHVFAYRVAIFRCFRCNTGQRTCSRQVKRRFPVFARRRLFPRFRPSLSRFYVFLLENGASYVSP
jgi:hypothetical protein